MKEMRRLLSFLLVLVMVIGFVPANAFAAEVSVDFTGSSKTHYLMFATDRHSNTSVIGNVIANINSQLGGDYLEYLGLGGDMVNGTSSYNSSTVLTEAKNASANLNAANVDLVYASSHDKNCNDDAGIMHKSSGLMYTGEEYYVYGITQDEMGYKDASLAVEPAQNFIDWVNKLSADDDRVIIVLSHLPIHSSRGDNLGAGYWHNALNTAATGSATGTTVVRDVVFFHGHNHTTENNKEYIIQIGEGIDVESYVSPSNTATAASVLESRVFDQETAEYNIASSSGSYTNYYTYATAGYLTANQHATLVTITDSTLTLTKYGTSGSGAAMTSVDRKVASTVTPTNLVVTGANEYSVGDTYVAPTVSVKYSDGTSATLTADQYTVDGTVDTSTAGTYTLTYKCTLNGYAATAPFTVTVKEAETEATTEPTTEPTEEEKTVSYMTISEGSGVPYVVGDQRILYKMYVIYKDGTEGYADQDDCTLTIYDEQGNVVTEGDALSTPGTYSADVTYLGVTCGTRLTFTVSASGDSAYDLLNLVINGAEVTADVKNVTEDATVVAAMATVDGIDNYVAYDITATLAEGETATVSIPVPTEWAEGELTVYYITDEGTVSDETFEVSYADGYATFTVSHFSTYVVGVAGSNGTVTEVTYVLDILDENGTVIDWVTSLEQVTSSTTLDLGYVLTKDGAPLTPTSVVFLTAAQRAAMTRDDFEKGVLYWTVNDDAIISDINETNGVVTFTGTKNGLVNVSLIYCEPDTTAWLYDTVTITVTSEDYFTPTDGATNFPEYPNPGSVNINKTATAVGNFSQTGIAQVELYGNGVPVQTTGDPIDVVLMLDMTGSMDDVSDSDSEPTGYTRIDATISASKAFIEAIVKNADGTYNKNRIGVYVFNKNGAITMFDFGTIDNDTEYYALVGKVGASGVEYGTDYTEGELDNIKSNTYFASGGTPYDDGLGKCEEVLRLARTTNLPSGITSADAYNRKQFCLFMTDGVPTSFAYVNGSTYGTHSSASAVAGMLTSASNYATRDSDYKYEYYSTEMKKAGVTVYSVGVGLNNRNNAWSGSATQCNNLASALLNDISGPAKEASQPDAVGTSTLSKMHTGDDFSETGIAGKYFFSVPDADAGENMEKIFDSIGKTISKAAATDVVIYDQITNQYELIFDFPTAMTTTEGYTNPIPNQEFYVEVVNYDLDESYNRTYDDNGDPVVETLIRIYVDSENKVAYYKDADGNRHDYAAYDETTGEGVTVTFDTNNKVAVIRCKYFSYNAATKSFIWTTDELGKENQIALRYFVYLSNSLEYLYDNDDSTNVPAKPYDTNTIAWIEYKNHLDNLCRQEFPVPQLTWNGAQVTYVFYLVNEDGLPVNKAGTVIPFSNAMEVTQRFTTHVVWNAEGQLGTKSLDVKLLAAEILPDYYTLYDEGARYEIHVFQNETGEDAGTNFFHITNTKLINGDDDNDGLKNDYTTKVYMDKSGVKYDLTGYYSKEGTGFSTVVSNEDGTTTTVTVADADDTAVFTGFDFADTTVAFAVLWTPELQDDVVVVDFGLDVVVDVTTNDFLASSINSIGSSKLNADINTGVAGTGYAALVDNKLTVENEAKTGQLTVSIENSHSVRIHQNSMAFGDPVTFYYDTQVSPLTNGTTSSGYMYSSVTVIPATTVYYEDSFLDLKSYSNGSTTPDDSNKWVVEGTNINATQASDRPGPSLISETLDADNAYGYDQAYDTSSMYSMGSSHKISVNANQYGTAEFSFYGTGFDVIALTSNTTGTLIVQVYDASDVVAKTLAVDTYFGYTWGAYYCTYKFDGNKWQLTNIGDAAPTEEAKYNKDELLPKAPTLNQEEIIALYIWKPVDSASPDALYQVPVMAISGLTYGKYTAKISALYYESLDHTSGTDGYDLYLDAIRIYDPAGVSAGEADDVVVDKEGTKDDLTVEGVYNKDGEGWPQYIELRNHLLDAAKAEITGASVGKLLVTFNDADDAAVPGAMFIDSNAKNESMADYTHYGPNNELYLANGQAISFNLDLPANVADVQIGMKVVSGGTASYQIHNAEDGGEVSNKKNGTLLTATDMYYSIKEQAEGGTIVVTNNSESACILSITDIKITFTQDPNGTSTADIVNIDGKSATNAVNSLAYVEVSKPTFEPGAMDISFNRTNAEVGNNVIVTVTTSSDVKNLMVNGRVATNKTTSYLSGETTWSFTVPVEDNSSLKVTVVGYDYNGEYTVPYTESVTVINMSGTQEDLLGKLFG